MADLETCPVCRTAEIVCGKWTLLLVRDLAAGRSRFCELERSLAGISPRTLSLRLRALEDEGIVERHTFPEVPPRVEYALTDKGLALLPLVEDMRAYGEQWLGSEEQAPSEEPVPSEEQAPFDLHQAGQVHVSVQVRDEDRIAVSQLL
jgi:DNA-binding HxlR family transcriptional regulator